MMILPHHRLQWNDIPYGGATRVQIDECKAKVDPSAGQFAQGSDCTGMKAFREQLREWGLGLALLALLLQTLIPLAQAIPVQRGGGDFDSLIVCTAWGVKLLQLNDDGESPVEPTASADCPVCSIHSLKLPLPGFDAPAPVPVFQAGVPFRPDIDYLPPEQAFFGHGFIRAPPLA